MTDLLFPTFECIDIALKVKLTSDDISIQTSTSGKEQRASFQTTPRLEYELTLPILRQWFTTDELNTLVSFYQQVGRKLNSFLIKDPRYSSVTNQQFGTFSTGITTYQLTDKEGIPVNDLNGAPQIYFGGVLMTLGTDYTISQGLVTLVTPPALNTPLQWSGSFYRRVRFDSNIEVEQVAPGVWKANTIKLITLK